MYAKEKNEKEKLKKKQGTRNQKAIQKIKELSEQNYRNQVLLNEVRKRGINIENICIE